MLLCHFRGLYAEPLAAAFDKIARTHRRLVLDAVQSDLKRVRVIGFEVRGGGRQGRKKTKHGGCASSEIKR